MTDYVYDPRKMGADPQKITVTAGASATVWLQGDTRGLAVRAAPGSGGSALVETSMNTLAEVDAAAATWLGWPDGTVTLDTEATMTARRIKALRLTATTAAADFWIA